MPKWFLGIVAGSLVITSAALLALATAEPRRSRVERLEAAIAEAYGQMIAVDIYLDLYYDANGAYGSLPDVARFMAKSGDAYNYSVLTMHPVIIPSPDAHAYAAVVDFSLEAGVKCAWRRDARGAPEPANADERRPRLKSWSVDELKAFACMRTSWPWAWLGWTGLSAVDNQTIVRATSRLP